MHEPGDGDDRGTGATPRDRPPGPPAGDGPGPEELAAIRELHAELRSTPIVDVLANHALGIWQLALVHLGVVTPPDETGAQPPADLAAAGLAIDALANLVDGLGDRFGDHEPVLRDALQTVQALFVEVADHAGDG